ncbi:MAG: hemin-degrading factor [Alphaproteobacteria bacterium]|nr:hemin-degrading factor [Alphaproteobacteria bacterium]
MDASPIGEPRLAADEINTRYARLRRRKPGIRARNAAAELGIAEVELVAARMGNGVTRLGRDPETILKDVLSLGEVMALTRNDHCVHERHGIYANPSFFRRTSMRTGLFLNPDIDLRLFMIHWSHCFAVAEDGKSGVRKSLQFFDKEGQAVHKIYLTKQSDEPAFDALVARHRWDCQAPSIDIERYAPKPADQPDEEIDWQGLRAAWAALRDTHDFFPMLKKFKVGRGQALRNVGADFAYGVDNSAARRLLEGARDRRCEIMVFVGNRGCIQIHTGRVNKLVEHGPWFNVLDRRFNLHLDESKIAQTWVTRKPTDDGIVTAVEVFNATGDLVVTFFGKRKPGEPELTLWRDIVAELPAKDMVNVA